MKTDYLVLGATGGMGFGFTHALIEKGKTATLLVRNKEKAIRYFGVHENIQIVEGDVLDTILLNELAKKVDYIFHGLSASYQYWEAFMPVATRKIVEAATQNRAKVIFPGNNYSFGLMKTPITELTPHNPNHSLGEVRAELEAYLEAEAKAGNIKTLIVRVSEIWGPGVTNPAIAPIFEKVQRGKAMPWVFTTKVPQQFAYNLDVGKIMLDLAEQSKQDYEVFNYAGTTFESIEWWFRKIAIQARQTFKQRVLSKGFIKILALFLPVMNSIADLAYKWENTILLDDSKLRGSTIDINKTPLDTAILNTLKWFQEHGALNPDVLKVKKQKRKKAILNFVAENAAIGLFPILLGLLGGLIPFIEKQGVIFGVVAGIYWTPAIRSLFFSFFSTKNTIRMRS